MTQCDDSSLGRGGTEEVNNDLYASLFSKSLRLEGEPPLTNGVCLLVLVLVLVVIVFLGSFDDLGFTSRTILLFFSQGREQVSTDETPFEGNKGVWSMVEGVGTMDEGSEGTVLLPDTRIEHETIIIIIIIIIDD